MAFVFDLPSVLQIDLFSGWLKLADVARLDNALCCKKYRADFLALICCPHSKFAKLKFDNKAKCHWVLSKNIKFETIVLFANVIDDDLLCGQLRTNLCGPFLKSVTLCTFQDAQYDIGFQKNISRGVEHFVAALAPSSPNLTRFRIKSETEDTDIKEHLLVELLTRCKKLSTLELPRCYCGHKDFFCALYTAPCLQTVVLTGTIFEGSVQHIPLNCMNHTLTHLKCTNLRLSEPGSDISDVCAHFPNLVSLHASDVTNEMLEAISQHCPLLQEVIICVAEVIEEETALQAARNWPHLRRLGIHINADPCAGFGNQDGDGLEETCVEGAVLNFIEHCLELTYFNTVCWPRTYFDRYPTRHFNALAESTGSKLHELYVSSLSIGGFNAIQTRCKRLRILALHHEEPYEYDDDFFDTDDEKPLETALYRINNSSIQVLYVYNFCDLIGASVRSLSGLRELHITHTQSNFLCGEDILNLAINCPDLEKLTLRNCFLVPDNFVLPLLDRCPAMTHLDLYNRRDALMLRTVGSRTLEELVKRTYPQLQCFRAHCKNFL